MTKSASRRARAAPYQARSADTRGTSPLITMSSSTVSGRIGEGGRDGVRGATRLGLDGELGATGEDVADLLGGR